MEQTAKGTWTESAPRRLLRLPGAVKAGVVSGFVAITCCVSPIVLVLVGVVTATEAVTLGNTLYYEYGWYFRGVGLLVGIVAFALYLRRRRSCSLRGARRHKGAAGILAISALVTYAAFYLLTTYLGVWFGQA